MSVYLYQNLWIVVMHIILLPLIGVNMNNIIFFTLIYYRQRFLNDRQALGKRDWRARIICV